MDGCPTTSTDQSTANELGPHREMALLASASLHVPFDTY
jgi:hypothetical protein